jgi:transposase-like protein
MARPSKRTPDRERLIIQVLEAGNTRRAACEYVGIDQDTLSRWCSRFADFADRVRKAEATAEVQAVAIIRQGIKNGDTADAKWWLERRRPEDYARHEKIDLEVYIRQRARELGIDEDEAVEAIKPRLRLVS